MDRRKFLRNVGISATALGVLGTSASCSTNQNEKERTDAIGSNSTSNEAELFFELSLAQWSVHKMIGSGALDPYDFAKKSSEWGFSGLEYVNHLYTSKIDRYSSLSAGLEAVTKELNKRAGDYGQKNWVMMVDLPPGDGDMAVADKSARKKAIEAHYPWVDATAALGCPSMRVNMFGTFDPGTWLQVSTEALSELSEYAADRNVNILVENHGYLSSNANLLMEVMESVNMQNCGTLPDFGNFCLKRKDNERWGAECIEEYDRYQGVTEMMPKAMAVSAKSYDFNTEGQETTIDYQKMLSIVRDAGYTSFIGVEYEGGKLSEEQGILATKALLTSIGKGMA